MWEQFEELLVPLFEFLGIPLVILGPLIVILYVLFKSVIPKMLSKNTSVTGYHIAKNWRVAKPQIYYTTFDLAFVASK